MQNYEGIGAVGRRVRGKWQAIVVSACRYLDAGAAQVGVPFGLGSRHVAAANMSAVTNTVGIVVSENSK
jgi:DNA integrity scanning protein DisA with diadenylate cyclase activity